MSRQMSKNELSVFDTPQSSQGKYPWATWTDGNAYAVKAGEDFNGKPESFRYLLRAHATKLNMTVDIRALADGEIAFRFEQAKTTEAANGKSATKAA